MGSRFTTMKNQGWFMRMNGLGLRPFMVPFIALPIIFGYMLCLPMLSNYQSRTTTDSSLNEIEIIWDGGFHKFRTGGHVLRQRVLSGYVPPAIVKMQICRGFLSPSEESQKYSALHLYLDNYVREHYPYVREY